MHTFKITAIFLMIFSASTASALVRIIPKDGYGKATESKLDPVTDRLNNIDSSLLGLPMGGAYDIVYTSTTPLDGEDLQVMVLKCPSLRQCSDSKENCATQTKYWQCIQLYQLNVLIQLHRYLNTNKYHYDYSTFIKLTLSYNQATKDMNYDLIF
jgi:hypothetical protein